ncbi:MAG: hypothetical protein ABIP48_23680 [Planctomycetota bacterium]
MRRVRSIQVLLWTGVAMGAIVAAVVGRPAVGQESQSAGQPAAETPAEKPVPEKAAAPKKREFLGRLPPYYGEVVDDGQRKKIYAIQREYAPKIDALKAQLAALMADRNEKVEAVLTPEQLSKVEQLKAEAKAKRGKAKGSAQ